MQWRFDNDAPQEELPPEPRAEAGVREHALMVEALGVVAFVMVGSVLVEHVLAARRSRRRVPAER